MWLAKQKKIIKFSAYSRSQCISFVYICLWPSYYSNCGSVARCVWKLPHKCLQQLAQFNIHNIGDSLRRLSSLQKYTTQWAFCQNSLTTCYLSMEFGEQAFSHVGPATWNALPNHISTVADPFKFRKLRKSHYFSQSFNICWFLCVLGVLAFGWLL